MLPAAPHPAVGSPGSPLLWTRIIDSVYFLTPHLHLHPAQGLTGSQCFFGEGRMEGKRTDESSGFPRPSQDGTDRPVPSDCFIAYFITRVSSGCHLYHRVGYSPTMRGPSHSVLPTPVITSNNSNPWEHEDTVVLTCGSETQNTSYIWWINNQSLPNSTRLELSEDKRTLTVFNVTRNDTGPYVCEARNPVSVRRSDPFTLNVLYPVARPSLQASNTTVTEHEGPVVLTCLTNETGVSIHWFFEGQSLLLTRGMTLSLDNSTLTIDPVSRKDAGDYQCEVSNRGNSSKSDPLRLHVKYKPTPESSSDLSAGAIVGIVIGVVAGVGLIAALVYFLYIRETRRATDQRDLTEHKSSDHNHTPGDTAPPRPYKPGSPTFHCRGHWLIPWSKKIPHAMEQLSPSATTTEPVLCNKRSHRSLKPTHHK
ncbi:hypothetical protein FD754_017979 [Muntiacus muntjak]|uniref:Ig-like domain-containing protein n=1 Tax=Muntiacus muntjak TaxID=9888 RepID=A0A5N3VVD9_MUNMU|nr:hypothetical protein FD754_017979 [Muntiacus muntjak]